MVYQSEAMPHDAKWYKYDPIDGWQDYSKYAGFRVDGRSVTLQLKDGVYGDVEGAQNGPTAAGIMLALIVTLPTRFISFCQRRVLSRVST